MMLRIIVCMSVGIRPDVIVAGEYDINTPELLPGIKINSKLSTLFPSKIISNGRFQASLPVRCADWTSMTSKY